MASTTTKNTAAASDDDYPRFKPSTVHEIFKTAFRDKNDPPKTSGPALDAAAEYLRLFTLEAIHRAAESAKHEEQHAVNKNKKSGSSSSTTTAQMDVEHLQANAAGLALDFGV